jgi:hypothetical protein
MKVDILLIRLLVTEDRGLHEDGGRIGGAEAVKD